MEPTVNVGLITIILSINKKKFQGEELLKSKKENRNYNKKELGTFSMRETQPNSVSRSRISIWSDPPFLALDSDRGIYYALRPPSSCVLNF